MIIPIHLHALAALLRKAGYTVDTAGNVREAEPLLAQAEVLISDIGLPDGNGCDLMRRFKDLGGLLASRSPASARRTDIARSERAGFSKHLTKPVDIEVLKAALQELWQPQTAERLSSAPSQLLL